MRYQSIWEVWPLAGERHVAEASGVLSVVDGGQEQEP